MTQYIDKSALVAEIEKRVKGVNRLIDVGCDNKEEFSIESVLIATIHAYEAILDDIDTLEVKEVDLENYVHGTVDYPIIGSDFPNIYPNYKELKNYCDKNRIMDNDKVKLIIVKEDMP